MEKKLIKKLLSVLDQINQILLKLYIKLIMQPILVHQIQVQ